MDIFVQTRDVNPNLIIKPACIFDYFQDLAGLHASELGVGYKDLQALNYAWVVLYQEYEIKKVPPYLAHTKLVTWPKPHGRLEFEREFMLQDAEGGLLIQGLSNWVVMNLTSRSLVRPSEIKFPGEYETFTNYLEKSKRRLNLDASKIENKFTHEVVYDDLDRNFHMNNAKYLTIVYNHFAQSNPTSYFKKVEIAYIKEARMKDLIEIGHYTIDEHQEAYIGTVSGVACFECVVTTEENI